MFLDMKKYFILLAAAFAAVACSQNELQDPNENTLEIPKNGFYAGIESKVTLEDDYSLSWEAGDKVAIWNGTEYSSYEALTSGKTTVILGEDVDENAAHCAFYPYEAVVGFEGNTVTAVIPGQQTPKVGTFPFNPSVAYAPAGEQTLRFYNICGLVGFEITEAEQGVTNVVIFGNNGEDLTGTVKVSYDEVTAPTATVVKGVKSVTLQADGTFAPGTYYVAILPQFYKEGITITMNTPEGKQYKKDSKPFTLKRSHRINAHEINDGEYGAENLISNAAELQAFFNIVNADENKGAGMTGQITANIDLSEIENFTPLAEFAGTLDGGEFTISNVTSHIIGTLAETGEVNRLNVSGNLEIKADGDVAFIVLNNAGKISYCKSSGTASTLADDLAFATERAIGGIAARTSGTIEYCTNEAAIYLKPLSVVAPANTKRDGAQFVGGIAGFATAGTIAGCTNAATGTITYTTPDNAAILSYACLGGILGTSEGDVDVKTQTNRVAISDSTNEAKITYESKGSFSGDKNNGLAIGGVVGYLEGTITGSSNTGEVYARGYQHDGEANITARVRPLAAAGVAGVVTESIENCTNAGLVDIDIAAAAGSSANQYFIGYNEVQVAGVVAKSIKKANDCHNTGAMKVNLHMTAANGSSGSVGGVIGWGSGSVTNCSNKARMEVTPRLSDTNVAGVLAKCNATFDKLSNLADETANAGIFVTIDTPSSGNQGKNLNVGGLVGWTGSNQTVTSMSNAAPLSLIVNDGMAGTRIVGGLVAAMGGSAKIQFKGTSDNYITNSGSIYVEGLDLDYIGGVVGRVQNSKNASDADANIYVKNSGDITINHTGTNTLWVGGIVSSSANDNTKGQWWIKSSINEGDINVTTKASVGVGGIEGRNGDTGGRLLGCTNTGDITINSAGATVIGGGLRGDGNGQINTKSLNTGDITMTTSAATTIQLAGVVGNDGTTVVNASAYDCNLTLNHTGTTAPKVYASLAVAWRQGANVSYTGTYGGNIRLLDKDGNKLTNGTIYCGLLEGYTASGVTVTLADVSLKKGTSVNGVEISEENYNSNAYLFPNLNGSTVTQTKVNLVD